MSDTWRDRWRPIIANVLKETAGQSEREIRKALREAWPGGLREYFPYKVWLDEIRVQLGLRKFGRGKDKLRVESCEGQGDLFT